MARNKETPLHFDLPDGDSVDLITWDFVLKELDNQLKGSLIKMSESNEHLKKIADKLESFIDDDAGEEE